jgi:hypothetical protein
LLHGGSAAAFNHFYCRVFEFLLVHILPFRGH